jgi:hypothetical protein
MIVAPLVAVTQAAYPLTTDSNCHCYKTNTTANYFSHHHFFDFRSLSQHVNVTTPLPDFDTNALAPPTSAYLADSEFSRAWAVMNWNNSALLNNTDVTDATVQMVNSPNNIYIERDDGGSSTHLTLRTVRHATFQSSAEFESRSAGYQFLSVRMHARTRGDPGAITAMFTYRPPPVPHNTSLVQEADLEIRTRDPPAYVQYTNQPAWNSTSDIPDATRNVTLPRGRRWSEWADWRMDWTPGSSTWYVNGELASRITFQAPRDPALVMFNAWSDGGSWSGDMLVGAQAYLQIQWIEMVYNSTDAGAVKTGGCANVCSIDETSKIGQPVLMTGECRPAALWGCSLLLTSLRGGSCLHLGQVRPVCREKLERVSELCGGDNVPVFERLLLAMPVMS